jgi:anti-anti-sigma regulatory factor
MCDIHIEKIGKMAVVECEGRMAQSDAAFRLRDAVISQTDAEIVVLDLSELYALGGGALGILVFLQRWARSRNIQLKVFNPSYSVRETLKLASRITKFDIAPLGQQRHHLAQGRALRLTGDVNHPRDIRAASLWRPATTTY